MRWKPKAGGAQRPAHLNPTPLLGGIAMPEKVVPGPVQDAACIREAVCIHTKKIFDSCREEDIAY